MLLGGCSMVAPRPSREHVVFCGLPRLRQERWLAASQSLQQPLLQNMLMNHIVLLNMNEGMFLIFVKTFGSIRVYSLSKDVQKILVRLRRAAACCF